MHKRVHRSTWMAVVLAGWLVAGCGGTQVTPGPTILANETLLAPLPTVDGGDPFDTAPPDPTSTPEPTSTVAAIACFFVPPAVGAGGSVFLQIAELGDWYAKDRYYTVVGVPNLQYQEFQKADGGPGVRYILAFDVPEYLAGALLDISVDMRDWDIHAPPALPGTASGSGRPESTHHQSACTGTLDVR